MKIKEIKEKKSKIKEIKKEEHIKENESNLDDFIEDDIEQFLEEEFIEEKDDSERPLESEEEQPFIQSLEDTVVDAPLISNPENEKQKKDFYQTGDDSATNDFYSGKNNGDNFYSKSNNLYGIPNEEGELTNRGRQEEASDNFYNFVIEKQERFGEIHSERGSQLELKGVNGVFNKKDSRKPDEKYVNPKNY